MRDAVRTKREKLIQSRDNDALGMKPPKWQESVTARDHGKMIATSSTNQQFLIRSGLADEKIVRADPQTTYAGTDTRDVYYHGWDVSRE